MHTLFLLLLLFAAPALMGNVGIFDGGGANLRISGTDKIQMVSERVEIRLVPADGPVTGSLEHLDRALYDCRFVLKNLSDQSVTALVGFPLIADDVQRELAKNPGLAEKAIGHYRFKASSGDTDYQPRYVTEDTEGKYRSIFAWKMTFAPGETVYLKVSYSSHGYAGLGLTRKRPWDWDLVFKKSYLMDLETAVMQIYPYVTQTAGTWAPPVERAEFVVFHADFGNYLKKRGVFADKPQADLKPEHARMDKLFRGGWLYRHIDGGGNWVPSADGQSLHRVEAPFARQEDIEVAYVFTVMPRSAQGLATLLEMVDENYQQSRETQLGLIQRWRTQIDDTTPEKEEHRRQLLKMAEERVALEFPQPFGDADRKNVADVVLEFYGIETGNADIADFLAEQNWYPLAEPRPIDPALRAELMTWHNKGKAEAEPMGAAKPETKTAVASSGEN